MCSKTLDFTDMNVEQKLAAARVCKLDWECQVHVHFHAYVLLCKVVVLERISACRTNIGSFVIFIVGEIKKPHRNYSFQNYFGNNIFSELRWRKYNFWCFLVQSWFGRGQRGSGLAKKHILSHAGLSTTVSFVILSFLHKARQDVSGSIHVHVCSTMQVFAAVFSTILTLIFVRTHLRALQALDWNWIRDLRCSPTIWWAMQPSAAAAQHVREHLIWVWSISGFRLLQRKNILGSRQLVIDQTHADWLCCDGLHSGFCFKSVFFHTLQEHDKYVFSTRCRARWLYFLAWDQWFLFQVLGSHLWLKLNLEKHIGNFFLEGAYKIIQIRVQGRMLHPYLLCDCLHEVAM